MIRIGASSCLLGNKCRYNGDHSNDDYVSKTLTNYFDFQIFCPEAAILGTPRESIRLVEAEGITALTNSSKEDVTEKLSTISKEYAKEVKEQNLRGFIFKAKSPSCGIERVKVYKQNGMPTAPTVGLFAKAVKDLNPYLPIEDEKRLLDPWLRENFIIHVYAYNEFLEFKESFSTFADLVNFHSRFKFFLQSKSETNYRKLGRIVANEKKDEKEKVLAQYEECFLETIAGKSDRGKVVNVCQHMQGFIKNNISKEEKEILTATLKEFHEGIVPLIAYLKPLEIYMKKYKQEYILNQFFLSPYPSELGLRSDIKAYK